MCRDFPLKYFERKIDCRNPISQFDQLIEIRSIYIFYIMCFNFAFHVHVRLQIVVLLTFKLFDEFNAITFHTLISTLNTYHLSSMISSSSWCLRKHSTSDKCHIQNESLKYFSQILKIKIWHIHFKSFLETIHRRRNLFLLLGKWKYIRAVCKTMCIWVDCMCIDNKMCELDYSNLKFRFWRNVQYLQVGAENRKLPC